MRHSTATKSAAQRVRELRPLRPGTEAARLKAAVNFRRIRGIYRDAYSSEEIEYVHDGRLIAFDYGHLRLGRFLTLRKRGQTRRAVRKGDTTHDCPLCGRRHVEPQRRPNAGMIKNEAKHIRDALAYAKRLPRKRR